MELPILNKIRILSDNILYYGTLNNEKELDLFINDYLIRNSEW